MKAALLFLTLVFALGALAYPPSPPDGRNSYNKLYTQEDFFEFDVLLSPEQHDAVRNGFPDIWNWSYRWLKDASGTVIVPIKYDNNFDDIKKAKLQVGADEYFKKTNGCIKFVERTTEVDYINMTNTGTGCYSNMGRIGGPQVLNYADWCIDSYPTVLHEMMHSLGFLHMQSTSDRDTYVTINWDNILENMKGNFGLGSWSTSFGYPYDYWSVLHYHRNAGAIDYNKYAIVTKDATKQMIIGEYKNLSDLDVKKLMAMYKCPGSSDLDIDGPPPSGDDPLDSNEPPTVTNQSELMKDSIQ